MSIEMPAVFFAETAVAAEAKAATGVWIETALAGLFAAAAVLLVSFLSVVIGL